MGHFNDARELIGHAKKELPKIDKAYRESLNEKLIEPELLIQIKNLMENLRSALDFVAHGLFERYGSSKKRKPRISFPYASQGETLDDFRRYNRVEDCIPGISASRPDIVAAIEKVQHFSSPSNTWLPLFMELNNENKHQRLTPQTRKEAKALRISSRGASVDIGEGASISVGPGASITIGDVLIPGGQTFDVNKPPTVIGPGRTELTTWVSFHFSSNGQPVIPFLNQAVVGVERIVSDLSSM